MAVDVLTPIGAETARLMDDPDHIDRILSRGAARASAIATPILEATRDVMGFVRAPHRR